ncbi:N-6 DNA methylase [Gilvimarinus sp. SDUM040013]|uniref:site-specific DNA-methyltransferase (adenine-specific) n=1 Tax=Gilvimarinus gilvus TaxID=3058038 RepID=A0ABU4S1H4_9GAMM|nr:N-6 DNA methylase [Gilvimarinus sp. SDUM040013]MDO3388118.1 N-6 DNA methylase [Gilvimarinus sp. SDUM040013]MDX6850307.1 N-6 DNA methylase [Gilvimarinus sp. SDUM040013]
MKSNFIKSVEGFGVSAREILLFDSSDPRLIDYLSLVSDDPSSPQLSGVIEASGRPLIYLLDAQNLSKSPSDSTEQVHQALNVLACRGELAYLAVVYAGQLDVYPVQSTDQMNSPASQRVVVREGHSGGVGFIRDLLEGDVPEMLGQSRQARSAQRKTVENTLFNLLMNVGRELNTTGALQGQHETILALTGRALLTRFLLDRDIITESTFPELFASCNTIDCFSSPRLAALTNSWLDTTFNGDLLKLPVPARSYKSWFSKLDPSVFKKLSFILGHADESGQQPLPGFINFAHVPVGLLSEVYERYAHGNLDSGVRVSARQESIHYTPRHIAEYILSEAFDGVTTAPTHQAKVLDPSCGAGVFVILAFRRLIAEHWAASGVRPDTWKIRDILYNQIAGFDINRSALTLAALGLYLSALELDPEPLPTSKLKFDHNLIGSVLHLVRTNSEPWPEHSVVMGSLGTAVPANVNAQYDVVVGNPPWSSFPKSFSQRLTCVVRDVAQRRDPEHLDEVVKTYQNPDQVPDLPFVWKSMDWAKPDGVIAFALHARVLFKNSDQGLEARNSLFKALNVTGIINGSALRNSRVWPRIAAQFCLLFGRNALPTSHNYFNYISPQHERSLNNGQGRMRIDFHSKDPVQAAALEERPHLLKTLYKGTPLDVTVIDHIQSLLQQGYAMQLQEYWDTRVGKGRCGVGFQTTSKKQDASVLIELGAKMLSKSSGAGYVINAKLLPKFDYPRLHRVRKITLYQPPLVVINKAPGAGADTETARIALGKIPIAYNESFYGYSCKGHPQATALAKYLFAVLNSDLLRYYTLMISSQYGIEREVIHKADIEKFPFVRYELLSEAMKNRIDSTYNEFVNSYDRTILNDLVYSIYEIDRYARQVISDTLQVGLPVAESKNLAERPVTKAELKLFCRELKKALEPTLVNVSSVYDTLRSWNFISITPKCSPSIDLRHEDVISEIADASGSSMITIRSRQCTHIGILNQYRYWTLSRARLIALQLLKDTRFLKD